MYRSILVLLLLFSFYISVYSQDRTEPFVITMPTEKVANSHYSTIKFLDSRPDTTTMGIVRLGAFNVPAKLITGMPFSMQMQYVMNALTDSAAGKEELLFQMRQFTLNEANGSMSEIGYCCMRASLYAGYNGYYRLLKFVDTIVLVKGMDVTKPMLKEGSQLITDFVASVLSSVPTDSASYSYFGITHIDSIEKHKLPVYNAITYTDGLYRTYTSFARQIPDDKIYIEHGWGDKIKRVNIHNAKDEDVWIFKKDIYAIVYKGQPYISTEFDYYPLTKKGDDFFFTGKAKVSADLGVVGMATLMFGLIGGLIASSDSASTFEMKIDHITGGFIRIKEIPDEY